MTTISENTTPYEAYKILEKNSYKDEAEKQKLLDIIKTEADSAYSYACNVIKSRWEEGEEVIKTVPWTACYYAHEVIKGRWLEAENIIKTDSVSAYDYARYVIKGRWLEAEDIIKKDPSIWYSDGGTVISLYAKDLIKGRWIEAEDIIKTNPESAYCYAADVIKGRWTEAENIIKADPCCAYRYARDVIKGRWIEAENIIKTDKCWNSLYEKNVIKDENFWKKREEELKKIKDELILSDPLKLINDIHQSRIEYERQRIEAEKKKERQRIEAEKERERQEQIRLQNIKNKHQNLNDWLSKIQFLINEHNIDISSLIPNQEDDFDEIGVKENIVEYVADHIPMTV
jgi:hypothetical protein